MLKKRIIPCLDVRHGQVVKGVQFKNLQKIADPVNLAAFYNRSGADELVLYDITAAVEGRGIFADIVTKIAKQVFIPLTVGGGVRCLDDFERLVRAGADKISVNSGALARPELIDQAAKRFGRQCVVLSVDIKRVDQGYRVLTHGGRKDTGREAWEWIQEGLARGAGELVINSMDADGMKQGFDLTFLAWLSARVSVPVIASGGAGCIADFVQLFQKTAVSGGLAASIFHQQSVSINKLKQQLKAEGIPVRQTA